VQDTKPPLLTHENVINGLTRSLFVSVILVPTPPYPSALVMPLIPNHSSLETEKWRVIDPGGESGYWLGSLKYATSLIANFKQLST
jgi:hypothetical protein